MNKKSISMMLAGIMMFSNATSAFAMSNEVDQHIQGNSLLIGNYLFELDKNANSFGLDSFITSARSIADGQDNEVYYKDASGNWYELIEDGSMSSSVTIDKIKNAITVRNGVAENTDPNVLASSDLLVSPATIVESTALPGTFDTEVTVTIKASNNAKFTSNVGTTVDSISSASLVRTAPTGTNMQITRLDDKNIKLKLIGTASSHLASLNTAEGTADNQKDYNKNGQFGDIKFLMLPSFFTGVSSVAEGGQYVVLDVQFNDGAVEDRIIDVAKTKALRIENVDYGVLVLKEGSIDDYTLTLNDVKVEPTKVNDSGSIVKFEINAKEVTQVKVVKKDDVSKTDTLSIGTGTQPFTSLIKDQDPDRVLISGPMSKFDYFLVDYDDNGVIRSELDKTTFDTENEGVKQVDPTVPKITVKESRLVMDDEWNNNVVLQVEEPSSVKSKKWLENIYDISKDYGTSAESRLPVQFTVDKEAGTVTIISKSRALNERNGHHKVILKSNSFNDVAVEFELILEAGSIVKNTNYAWYANQELMFELHDFSYGVTNPIYEVWLNGEKLSKEGDTPDYYVISNIVTLYNDTKAKLTEGEHNLVIKVHGYEDFERTFTLKTAPDGLLNPSSIKADAEEVSILSVDAVSAASGAVGGSTGSDGSSSGGGMIRANVIYDFDHIVNAYILLNLGMNTPYADTTITWWEKFTKDAIITDGSKLLMDYEYFADNSIDNGKKYPTFEAARAALIKENLEEHLKFNPNAKADETPEFSILSNDDYNKPGGLYVNRPYTVKNMMHDGEIGDLYYFGEVTAKDAADISVKGGQVLYGNDVVIEYTGSDEWAEALVSIKQNSAYMKFDVDTIAKTVTLKYAENSFITGENKYEFNAPGFKSKTLKVEIYKAEQKNVTIKKDDSDNIIVEGFDKDFLSNIMGLSLAGKPLHNDSQVGNNGGQYEIRDTQLILRSSTFGEGLTQHPKDKQLTLMIHAEGYDTFTQNFTVVSSDAGVIELKDVPEFVKLHDGNKNILDEVVEIDITGPGHDKSYANAINEVYLDGNKLTSDKYGEVNHNLVIDRSLFTEVKDYAIKIVADKYKDKELNVTITDNALSVPSYVAFEQDGKTVDMGEQLILSFDDGQLANVSDYAKAVKTIKIGETAYDVSLTDESYDISSKIKVGQNDIVIIADKYENITFTVMISEVASPAKLIVDGNKVNSTEITLDMPEAVKVDLGHYYENMYEPMITKIGLDGTGLVDGDYSINKEGSSRVLTINVDNFSYGNTYSVKIEATGYADADLTVTVKEKAPDKAVPSYVEFDKDATTVDMGTDLTLNFKNGSNSELSDYAKLIREIKINDTVYSNNVNLNTYDITSEVSEGLNTITVKAEGYLDKVFTVTISEIISPAKFYNGDTNNLPEETVKTLKHPETVEIYLGYSTGRLYRDKVEEVVINDGVSLDLNEVIDFKSNNHLLILNKDNFEYDSTYTVTIKADGYNDAVFTINVDAKVALEDVPEYIKLNKNEIRIGQTAEIRVFDSFSFNDKSYEESLREISIRPITSSGSATIIKVSDILDSGSYDSDLEFNSDLLELGDNEIVIKSERYKDFVSTLKLLKKELPYGFGIWNENKKYGAGLFDSDDINLVEGQELLLVVDDYKDDIISIKVDGKAITDYTETEVGSFFKKDAYSIPLKHFSEGATSTLVVEIADTESGVYNITIE